MTYAKAKQRGDNRGMHIASHKAFIEKTLQLNKEVYDPRSKASRNIKQIMGGK